jgi:hypothetical protein
MPRMFSAKLDRCPEAGLADIFKGGDRGPELEKDWNGEGLPLSVGFFMGVPSSTLSAIVDSYQSAGEG